MRMVMLSMTQAKKKKFKVHNYERSCGNCGLGLMEDEDIIFVPAMSSKSGQFSPAGSNYFHRLPEGCAAASNRPVIIPQGYKERLYLLDDLL